ncbi:MAG TPA: GGDEF domain-containing protein [Bacillota bacterium]|nr:GGDEF domain-containing protein [Bacillota bacterium]
MILRSKNGRKRLAEQLGEVNQYLTNVLAGDAAEYESAEYQGELRILCDVFLELFQQIRQKEAEDNERYHQLQLSYISLEEKYAQSYTFRFIQEQISRELNSHELINKTIDVVMGVFGSRRSIIYMMDEAKNALVVKASLGYKDNSEYREEIPFTENSFYVQTCKEKKVFTTMVSGSDTNPDEQFQIMMVPLNARHSCLGLMVLEVDICRTIDQELMEFAESIARELSLSLENAYLYDKMRNMAIRDGLTGVYNRMYLMNYMTELFAEKPEIVTVMIFDLDHFKQVNDRFGHLNGDMVLKTTARLTDEIVKQGTVARYGGEEFVIVLPQSDQETAAKIAEQVRSTVEKHGYLTEDGERIPVTLSIGLASYPLVANNYEELLQLADHALYQAKNSGRNRVCIA